jgi:hypothetical protein
VVDGRRRHPAGALQPGVRRRAGWRRVEALALQQIGAVDRGGGDVDEHLARLRLGIGHLGPLENLWTARLYDRHGVHVC